MQREQRQAGVSLNGLTSEDFSPSIFRLWTTALGEPGTWAQADHYLWDHIATKAIRLIDENIAAEVEMSLLALAKALATWGYHYQSLSEEEAWARITPRERLAWEMVGRHMVNCLDSEVGSIRPEDLEERTLEWFQKKLGQLPKEQSDAVTSAAQGS